MKLTVIIIALNEQEMIGGAIESADFADQVIVADGGSIDKTVEVAKKHGAEVVAINQTEIDFSDWRNKAIKHAQHDWVLYLDSDERITEELKEYLAEGRMLNAQGCRSEGNSRSWNGAVAFALPRQNFYLGHRVKHGGSWPDYVIRLFYKPKFVKWEGKLHEQPKFEGKLKHLKVPLEHHTHRDLTSMLEKSTKWTKSEAKLLYDANHPPVVWWRILRMMFSKFWERVVKQGAWKDGTVGWINALFEVFNTFIIYSRLWQMQKKER